MATQLHGRPVHISPKTWLLLGGLAAALIIPAWILMYLLYQFSPMFDHRKRQTFERHLDANWQIVHGLGDKAWRQLEPQTFAALHGGDWSVVCVNGGHSDPVATFEAAVGEGWVPPHFTAMFNRPLAVADYDLVVSFADRAGGIDMLYFVDGGSMQSMRLSWCTKK